ncbi:MAG: outer membrane protein assembly factor BamD [Rhodobacteraceae bacterium]|nr:outer membrane protein assembly factor BamD [Paracoccaceae bacterium]
MARSKAWARLAIGVVALALLAGCASREVSVLQLETREPDEIFRIGEAALEDGRPGEAAEIFAEIERLYPYSEWARRGLIMSAASFHRARDFDNSRASAQRFLDFFPADEDAAYAQYLLALSYYDQIDRVGRDQGLTFQALRGMRDVVSRFPDSDYARSAMMKFELAFDQLAAKEMEVGRYYLRRNHFTAAINRFRVVVEDYQTSTQTPEALHRLVEAYLSLGLTEEAQTAAAILGHNFQSSEWYEDSFRLLTRAGLEPEARGDGWLRQIYRQTILGQWL